MHVILGAQSRAPGPRPLFTNILCGRAETVEMNKQGVRHRNHSEDDNTPMSPTLSDHPSYKSPPAPATMKPASEESDDVCTNSKSQYSPFSAHNRTVFEHFPDDSYSADYHSANENNEASAVTASLSSGIGSLGSYDSLREDFITDNQQPKKITTRKIDYKAKTQPVRTITHFSRNETFTRLNGIAINRFGEMLVSDRYHNKIMCYDRTLKTCHSVGCNWAWLWSKDEYNNSFYWPSGLASDRDGHFFVADRHNHCIKEFAVIKVNLEFISKIGSVKGAENGYFNEPRGLAISSKEDKMYIADGCNNRVQIFQNRVYLSKFGCAGTAPGQFNIPCSIAISNDDTRLFVSDNRNHRVQIFKNDGRFEQQVVHDKIYYPHGICITPDDHFIVSSSGYDCVLVFKIRGTDEPEHVTTIEGKCGGGVECFKGSGDVAVTNSGLIVIASHSKIVFY